MDRMIGLRYRPSATNYGPLLRKVAAARGPSRLAGKA
jgi:hypothetical protein